MTMKTTLSLAGRHHRFLTAKVNAGAFAPQSALVAVALEQMIHDEEEREVAPCALAGEIRSRPHTPRDAFLDTEGAFVRACVGWDAG